MQTKANRLALQVSLTYTALAVLWIICSNQIVARFVADPKLRLIYTDVKGLAFVLATGFLLHQVLRRLLYKWSLEMEQRQQAERAKFEGEKLYRRLFEVETDAVFLVDCASHQILDANPAAERMYGYCRDEFLQMLATDISAEPEKTRDAIAGRLQFVPARLHRRRDGAVFTVEVTTSFFEFKGCQVHVVAMRDITSRRRVEEALRNERDFSAGIINKAPSIICGLKSDGTTIFINPAGEAVTGYESGAMIGKNWWQTLYPGDEYRQVDQLLPVLAAGEVRDYEMTLTTKCGVKRIVAWNSIIRRDTLGNITEIIGFGNDVSERKLQQLQLQLQSRALSAAANAIVITDSLGRVEWVNPAFLKLTGYAEAEIVGRNIRILNSGEQSAEFYAGLWAVITRGEVWHGELTNRRRDGSVYREDMTITPVQNESGQIAHFIAIKQDVTERRQLDARLRQAEKMEAIGTLAGGIAHDFNNILAAMVGYAYLLQQGGVDPAAVNEHAGEILKAAERAKDLVQQILTFSRQREQTRQPLHLELVVKEALKFLRASLPAGVKLNVNLAAGLPSVLADPTQIYQVILNLATNSMHAMEGCKGILTVGVEAFTPDDDFLRTRPEARAATYVRLTVADNGRGIDAAIMGRIFEPFFTTKPLGKGTGLGLSVVHGIVQSHEGFISAESQPGRGTTFQLYFPAQTELPVLPTQDLTNLPPGNGEMILLLDDEPTLTRLLEQLLQRLNYQTVTCNDPRAAVALFRENPARFDLVITDLTMPDLNGVEVARQLREAQPAVRIILASGTHPEMDDENLWAAGIVEIVEKPVAADRLAHVLKRALAVDSLPPFTSAHY
jgi:PAS domain S-box-containing protein